MQTTSPEGKKKILDKDLLYEEEGTIDGYVC